MERKRDREIEILIVRPTITDKLVSCPAVSPSWKIIRLSMGRRDSHAGNLGGTKEMEQEGMKEHAQENERKEG